MNGIHEVVGSIPIGSTFSIFSILSFIRSFAFLSPCIQSFRHRIVRLDSLLRNSAVRNLLVQTLFVATMLSILTVALGLSSVRFNFRFPFEPPFPGLHQCRRLPSSIV